MRKQFAYAKTKTQISFAVTAKLISSFFFRYMDSKIPLLSESKVSSMWPSSVLAQLGLCRKPHCWFSHGSLVYILGDGIKISEDVEELLHHIDESDQAYVMQRYIENPFLLEGGRKFDIR